ncbi:MAG: UDP-N-acetylglucosamine 2-epimerase (hydrolyzing) [Candidatus Lokiarchaeota archaeon]|nr:UDP-N-acetylglucosamine 2-epimerase (hydrolyzing) [Candidatus Lokiarchaeota archaeon]
MNICFITSTRADFGKLESLIQIIEDSPDHTAHIFATGMHMLHKYGYTFREIEKKGFKYVFRNQHKSTPFDMNLTQTIKGLEQFLSVFKVCFDIPLDLIVIHGDRIEALAGAIIGNIHNIPVAHIEGGEVSGTIDGIIRHAITKFSHIHLVANEKAKMRLTQLGEAPKSIHIIGSPDMDILLSDDLPTLEEVKQEYHIPGDEYAILIYHPNTFKLDNLEENISNLIKAVKESNLNYIVIMPNSDLGNEIIYQEFLKLQPYKRFEVFPSIRFERFLTLLKHAQFIIGNSSAGIREAPYYGTPTINIGSRQQNRSPDKNIINTDHSITHIKKAIEYALRQDLIPLHSWGDGNSDKEFLQLLHSGIIDRISLQKQFHLPIYK